MGLIEHGRTPTIRFYRRILTHFVQPGKAQEAALTYDDMIDKYTGSAMLYNGLAVAKMHGGHFEEAEASLQEAIAKVSRCCHLFFWSCCFM